MWILVANLPLIIGDQIPHGDEKWECFLLLLDIVQLCMGRVASPSLAGILGTLIEDHHNLFCRCYPTSSVIPKMHYMVHLPQQMLRYRTHILCMHLCIFTLLVLVRSSLHGAWEWKGKIHTANGLLSPATSIMCLWLWLNDTRGGYAHISRVQDSLRGSLNVDHV